MNELNGLKEDIMKEKIGRKFLSNRDILESFLLCGLAMFIFCVYSVTRYPRESTLLTGDVFQQYIPAIRSFVKSIWAGSGVTYSWDIFLGMNTTEFYGTYVGGSFINLIYVIFPQMSPEVFFCIALTLKVALAGAGFTYFAKNILHVNNKIAVFFSLFFALCGFQFGINIVNYIWMDALYLLPLIITQLVRFIEERKWKGLVALYAYLFICNFYMGYMVGIFSAIYFVTYMLIYKLSKKEKLEANLKLALQYAGYVLVAIAMSMFSVLPIATFLLNKSPLDTTTGSADLVEKNILMLISRLAFGIEVSNFVQLPHLYVGVPAILLVGLFFISRNIEKKEKLLYGILTVVMVLPCCFLPLYMFWHGFDNPDSWYHRFTYITSFLLVCMSCKAFDKLLYWKKKQLLFVFGVESALFTLVLLYAGKKNPYQQDKVLIYTGVLLIIWILVMMLYHWVKEKPRNLVLFVAVLIGMWETIMNGCMTDRFFMDQAKVDAWQKENTGVAVLLNEDKSFYRVNYENSYSYNYDTGTGLKGLSDFWSYENYELKNTLGNLGMYASPRVLKDMGITPVTQMLLGVKYIIRGSNLDNPQALGAEIYSQPYVLQLGYLVSENVENISFESDEHKVSRVYQPDVVEYEDAALEEMVGKAFFSEINVSEEGYKVNNVFTNCNSLLQTMTELDDSVFQRVPEEKISTEATGVIQGKYKDNYFLYSDLSDAETKLFHFIVQEPEKDVYVSFEGNNLMAVSNLPRIYNYSSAMEVGDLGVRYAKKLDFVNNYRVCTVAMAKGVTRKYASFKEAQFYTIDQKALENVYQVLSKNQLNIHEFRNGFVKGSLEVPEQNKLLFTSIPYDEGWKVSAGNQELEVVPLLDGAFLGVKFPGTGSYELTFSYEAPGLKPGISISIGGLFVFIVLLYGDIRKRKREEQK